MAQGFVDPINAQALKSVRIEVFPSLDAEAAALVETTDPKRGILNDCPFLQLRKGKHEISVNAPGCAGRGRAQALEGFESLGRLVANSL